MLVQPPIPFAVNIDTDETLDLAFTLNCDYRTCIARRTNAFAFTYIQSQLAPRLRGKASVFAFDERLYR